MAHRRRSGFEKKIDTVHWTYGSFSFSNVDAATSSAATVFAAQHLPETLMRTRGSVSLNLDGVQAPGVGVSLAIGFIQVPEGTGTTVLWSPITDGDAPWIWWDTREFLYDETVQDVIGSQATLAFQITIDSKAMRKLRNTELQMVVQNATLLSSSGVNVFGAVRCLFGS